MYKEIKGDLIDLALKGKFDVIAHGCNCFCKQKSGIARQMVENFGTDNFYLECYQKGDINKLGQIDFEFFDSNIFENLTNSFTVINCYTQYKYGRNHKDGVQKPLDYDALKLCLKKINHIFVIMFSCQCKWL